jgi:hypothetical protein
LLRLMSDKATWNQLKQAEYYIKSRRRWCSSRAVVCLIDTAAAKPEGSAPTSSSLKQKRQKRLQQRSPAATYASGHLQQQENIRKKYRPASLTGTGRKTGESLRMMLQCRPMGTLREEAADLSAQTVNVAP